jgi:type III pantothenate kinase
MARSLHDYTAKLPHVRIEPRLPTRARGTNTEDAIQVGIAYAILSTADRIVSDWSARSSAPPWVFATGGDVGYFQGFVFTAKVGAFIIDPMLTLEGIRIAAEALK